LFAVRIVDAQQPTSLNPPSIFKSLIATGTRDDRKIVSVSAVALNAIRG